VRTVNKELFELLTDPIPAGIALAALFVLIGLASFLVRVARRRGGRLPHRAELRDAAVRPVAAERARSGSL
jgi:hypothetical protein